MKDEGTVMTCTEVQESILDYLEGHGDPEKSRLMEMHLASCEACRMEKNAYEKSWAMVKEWPDIEPDPLFRAKFWEQAAHYDRPPMWIYLESLLGKRAGALAALVSMFIVLGGICAWYWNPSPPWESQAFTPWNRDMMEHIAVQVDRIEEAPRTAGTFFEDRALITLPDYVNEGQYELYPELQIGKSSLAIMDGAYEMMGSMAGAEE